MGVMESVTGNEGCHIIIVRKTPAGFKSELGNGRIPIFLLSCLIVIKPTPSPCGPCCDQFPGMPIVTQNFL